MYVVVDMMMDIQLTGLNAQSVEFVQEHTVV